MNQAAGLRKKPTLPPGPLKTRTAPILLLLAGAAAAPWIWQLSRSNPSATTSSQAATARPSSRETVSSPEATIQGWIRDPAAADAADLARRLMSHGKLQRSALTEEIAAAYEKDPQRYEAALKALVEEIFASDPNGALGLLARLHVSPGIIPIERELMNRWIGSDVSLAAESLRESSHAGQASPLVQLAFLSSICQNEQTGQLPVLIQWVRDLKDPRDASLRISAVESLVETSGPATFAAVSGMLTDQLDDPAMAAWAGRLASRQIAAQPDATLDWLRQAPAGEGRRSMLDDVIGALAASHPETAANLINDPDRLAELFGTPGNADLDPLQDAALARYLDVTMSEAPDNALAIAGMFHDEAMAAAYGKKARALLAASTR